MDAYGRSSTNFFATVRPSADLSEKLLSLIEKYLPAFFSNVGIARCVNDTNDMDRVAENDVVDDLLKWLNNLKADAWQDLADNCRHLFEYVERMSHIIEKPSSQANALSLVVIVRLLKVRFGFRSEFDRPTHVRTRD